jgi:hypothetical protein
MDDSDVDFSIISTPALSSHQVVTMADMANIYIPADVYRRFSTMCGDSSIIVGGMNFFTRSSRRKEEEDKVKIGVFSRRNYTETVLLLNQLDIEISKFTYTDPSYYYFMVERSYSYMVNNGFINENVKSLSITLLAEFVGTYLNKVNRFPLNIFDAIMESYLKNVKVTLSLCSDMIQLNHGYETCFEKDFYYDEILIESIMNNVALSDLRMNKQLSTHQVRSLVESNYSNIFYTIGDRFTKDVYISPTIIAAMGKVQMIPTDFVMTRGIIGTKIKLEDYCNHINIPFASDMLRGTFMTEFPYGNSCFLSFKDVYFFYKKIKDLVVNPVIRLNNFVSDQYKGSAPKLEPSVEIKYNKEGKTITAHALYLSLKTVFNEYIKHMNAHNYSRGLKCSLSMFANIKNIYELNNPWDAWDIRESETIFSILLNMTVVGNSMMHPFMPKFTESIFKVLGFNRIMDFSEIELRFSEEIPMIDTSHIFSKDVDTLRDFEKFNVNNCIFEFGKITGNKITI